MTKREAEAVIAKAEQELAELRRAAAQRERDRAMHAWIAKMHTLRVEAGDRWGP